MRRPPVACHVWQRRQEAHRKNAEINQLLADRGVGGLGVRDVLEPRPSWLK